jgi:sugar/nucleoside kinase (ribokinase family)
VVDVLGHHNDHWARSTHNSVDRLPEDDSLRVDQPFHRHHDARRVVLDGGVSRSARSTIAGDADRIIEVRSPELEVVDGRGGGDSMPAALAVAAAHGSGFDETLRIAAAAAALNVSRHVLGTVRRDSVEELAAYVEIIDISRRRSSRSAATTSMDSESMDGATRADRYRRAR